MGLEITKEAFEEKDYVDFAARARAQAEALEALLARPGFGLGERTLGAELELYLVDRKGEPLFLNREVLARTLDPRLTLELDRFNLELNLKPVSGKGAALAALHAQMTEALAGVRAAAATLEGRVATIGILPTLAESHLTSAALTDLRRYRALSQGTKRARQRPFAIRIEGEDALDFHCDDVTAEGANTSFQLHLRVAPGEFAGHYNAAQIATGPALAASANSPFLLGRRLWDETRIALFRQSVDDRPTADPDEWRPARVSFGHGWVRRGASELFSESVGLHPPLLPVVGTEDFAGILARGGVPKLDELRLHHGTVWRWNRAVYDDAAGGHLRVELRALPSGPTPADMVASAAFLLGLTLAIAPEIDRFTQKMTFGHARRNFYCAARSGLDAELLWPARGTPSPEPRAARELVASLVPLAREGLESVGIDSSDARAFLSIFAERVKRGTTGAAWQRRALARLEKGKPRQEALRALLLRYLELSESGKPVHEWEET